MRQFNYFANGGPFPGSCLSCGNNKELFDLGKDEVTNASYLLCTRCISEIASFTGHILREPAMREAEHLKSHIRELEAKLENVPAQVEGLINGIRSSTADFVLAISSSGNVSSDSPVSDDTENRRKPGRPRKTEDSDD
jgi:hypothetical protein